MRPVFLSGTRQGFVGGCFQEPRPLQSSLRRSRTGTTIGPALSPCRHSRHNQGRPASTSRASTYDGASTAYSRHQLGIPKTHVNGAACLDLPNEVTNTSGPATVLKRHRRHTRQSINCDAKGSPDNKEFPTYSRLPKSTQGYTTPPAHSRGPRRLRGIRSGDIVCINQVRPSRAAPP